MRLALKLFRREPAISEFDWNFSATHNSSAAFSTEVGSALHGILLPLQPDHGEVTRFRAHCALLNALFRLALASPPVLQHLKLATHNRSPDRSTKSTLSPVDGL